ncbi:helix-turn-helix transcriptional regulator [Vibrio paucivorans]
MRLPTIDKRIVLSYLKQLKLCCGSYDQLVDKAGMPFSLETTPALHVPFLPFSKLLHLAKLEMQGADFTQYLIHSVNTVPREAINLGDLYGRLPLSHLQLSKTESSMSLQAQLITSVELSVESELSLITLLHASFNAHVRTTLEPISYHLQSTSSQELDQLKIRNDIPQYMGAKATTIEYSVYADTELPPITESEQSFTESVRQSLAPYIGRQDISLENLAEISGMSRRTTQRYLQSDGSTFRGIKEQLNIEFAKRVLVDRNVSIADVAIHLGYSDSAQFIRAFKRVTKSPPKQWLKEQLR